MKETNWQTKIQVDERAKVLVFQVQKNQSQDSLPMSYCPMDAVFHSHDTNLMFNINQICSISRSFPRASGQLQKSEDNFKVGVKKGKLGKIHQGGRVNQKLITVYTIRTTYANN